MHHTSDGSRPSTDEYFLQMAELVATRSTCYRRAVGCVIVDAAHHVMSTGYNGVARGQPHCNEVTSIVPNPLLNGRKAEHWEQETSKVYGNLCEGALMPSGSALHMCQAVHAEQSALVQCRDILSIHTIYCTASPCVQCMRMILSTAVKRIVFRKEYPHAQSQELAARAGIEWRCLSGL